MHITLRIRYVHTSNIVRVFLRTTIRYMLIHKSMRTFVIYTYLYSLYMHGYIIYIYIYTHIYIYIYIGYDLFC